MRTLDLFAGIGGFSLAGHWMGWETAAFVEWDSFCQKVLAKNFPNVPIYGDIKDFHYEQEKERIGPVDLICGGFPCQPFSTAGKRNGMADDRYLWPEMLRVIREVKPAWVVGENVAGLLSMDGGTVFEEICSSLENEGYTVEAFVLPAISRGAPHRRDRVWITAQNAERRGLRPGTDETWNGRKEHRKSKPANEVWGWCICGTDGAHGFTADTSKQGFSQPGQTGIGEFPTETRTGMDDRPQFNDSEYGLTANSAREQDNTAIQRGFQSKSCGADRGDQWREHWYEAATRLCSMDDGVSGGLVRSGRINDRAKKLKAAGNAIVPQVAYEIFRAIQIAQDELPKPNIPK